MNQSVDNYFIGGCGRYPLGGTLDCKVHNWSAEMQLLRNIILEFELVEESKWGVPCYTLKNKNVLMISAFNDYCSISFFKGSLLRDDKKLLVKPGLNSQSVRLFKFRDDAKIPEIADEIRAYIIEAIQVEKKGLVVHYRKNPEPLPMELKVQFDSDPILRTAFESLTPGRQRGYILYFSKPIKTKTRESRILKSIPMILSGIGLHDKYQSKKK